jgi:RNA polymerase sigma-70 factor (ECF subfamily)
MNVMKSQEQLYDELLVLRCQQQDAAAFDELVGRWQERLWRYAFRVTGRNDLAWDLVQETWIAVIKGISRLHDVAAFPQWIYRILTDRHADLARKQARQRRLQLQMSSAAAEATKRNSQNQRDDLQTLIERLPPEQQALIVLRYGEEFSIREMAAVLGIPEGTVKSRLFHTKQKLREGLERERERSG